MQHKKLKSVSKEITTKGESLKKLVLDTMQTISEMVGVTYGPGGNPILIERHEYDLPPIISKDGVTVFRNLGFTDATKQVILESSRDAATKTAKEAGDGTTLTTILSEAIVKLTYEYCAKNPRISPQKVVRKLQTLLNEKLLPALTEMAIPAKNNPKLLKSVAKISANNEEELANAVMECFRLVGDDGNVTIMESSGNSGYKVEKIDGYPIPIGYDQCCNKYSGAFINDPSGQRVYIRKPVFLLYYGTINNVNDILELLMLPGTELQKNQHYAATGEGEKSSYENTQVIVVATGFADSVLASFAHASRQVGSIGIYPLLVPMSPFSSGQKDFIDDMAAVTGATVFDPITLPPSLGKLEDLGPGVEAFEATKYRSNIFGNISGPIPDVIKASRGSGYDFYDDQLLGRATDLQTLLMGANSVYEGTYLQERIGKLTGGIAKLHVVGSSNGEVKERKDRAEDAVCAVKGAIKHGCLPGGGWSFLKLCNLLKDSSDSVVNEVLKPALLVPVFRLLSNCGFNEEDAKKILEPILLGIANNVPTVYDAYEQKHGDPVELGVLDSASAISEALKNSLSIATLLGTLGGTVVYKRDAEFERSEAAIAADNQD